MRPAGPASVHVIADRSKHCLLEISEGFLSRGLIYTFILNIKKMYLFSEVWSVHLREKKGH